MSNFQIYTINKSILMWLWSGNTKFTTPLPLNFNKFQFYEQRANWDLISLDLKFIYPSRSSFIKYFHKDKH